MSAYTKKKRIKAKPSPKAVLVKKKPMIPTKIKRKKADKDASRPDDAKLKPK